VLEVAKPEEIKKICQFEDCRQKAYYLGRVDTPIPSWYDTEGGQQEFLLACDAHAGRCDDLTLLCQEEDCINLATETKIVEIPHPTAEDPNGVRHFLVQVCKMHI